MHQSGVLGVGEPLPILDTSPTTTPTSLPSTPEKMASPHSPDSAGEAVNEAFMFQTPRKPPHRVLRQTASFYNGLDSSAGVKLLMSPAITRRTKSCRPDTDVCICMYVHWLIVIALSVPLQTAEQGDSSADKEEISRLKHSVRVLEGTLQVEKKLAQEYYTELCSKIQECEEMKNHQNQLDRKLECLQQMSDIQDELAHAMRSLTAAEQSNMALQSKLENMEAYKEKATELEAKMSDYEAKVEQCKEYHMVSEVNNLFLIPYIRSGLYVCSQ